MEPITLKAAIRTGTKKGFARSLKRQGRFPAVLYGPSTSVQLLSLSSNAVQNALKNVTVGQSLFNLEVENGGTSTHAVMIHDLQRNPLTGAIVHADFYEFDARKKLKIHVPVTTTGKSIGVEKGGILQIVERELEILCRPLEIPGSIRIDVSDLDIGHAVHVRDIPLQGDLEILTDANFTVVTVLSARKEQAEPGPEGEAAAAGEASGAKEAS